MKEQRWAYHKKEEKEEEENELPEGKDESYCDLKAPAAQPCSYKEPH